MDYELFGYVAFSTIVGLYLFTKVMSELRSYHSRKLKYTMARDCATLALEVSKECRAWKVQSDVRNDHTHQELTDTVNLILQRQQEQEARQFEAQQSISTYQDTQSPQVHRVHLVQEPNLLTRVVTGTWIGALGLLAGTFLYHATSNYLQRRDEAINAEATASIKLPVGTRTYSSSTQRYASAPREQPSSQMNVPEAAPAPVSIPLYSSSC